MIKNKTKIKERFKVSLKLILVCAMALPLMAANDDDSSAQSGVSAVAKIAYEEYQTYGSETGGAKYKEFMGWGSDSDLPWCAAFVSWCANEAGLTNEGYATKSGSVAGFINFYEENPDKGTVKSASETTPVSGDFFCQGTSHIGIVYSYDADTDMIQVVEGNWDNQIHFGRYKAKGAGITDYIHPAKEGDVRSTSDGCSYSSSTFSGTSSADLGSGETIEIPSGLGKTKSFMGWSTITSPSSSQYKLREKAGENYDENGFAKIDGRYVIACTLKYGDVGDYVDWQFENGEVLHSIIGDIKSSGDAGINEWGHDQGNCIIEFIVNKEGWYDCGVNNPNGSGDPSAVYHRDEWYQQAVTIAVNCGNYYDGSSSSSNKSTSSGCSSSTASSSVSGTDLSSCTQAQKDVYNEAMSGRGTAAANYCLQYVNDVFDNSGHGVTRYCCAHKSMIQSNAQKITGATEIPIGACVFTGESWGPVYCGCGLDAGHIGIYVGNGEYRENVGGIRTSKVETFMSKHSDASWGWLDGVDLSKQ